MYQQKYVVTIICLLVSLIWAADNTDVILQPDAIAIPKMLNYQGKLVNLAGNPVTDSTYSIAFRFFTSSTGGSAFWNETQDV